MTFKCQMKLILKCLLVISTISFSYSESKSQSFGIVKDSVTNDPVPYVNIWLHGESIGTTTNENGEFSFKSNLNGRKVILSSIGYKTKEVVISSKQEIIFLKPEIIQLKEVVIKVINRKQN